MSIYLKIDSLYNLKLKKKVKLEKMKFKLIFFEYPKYDYFV